MRKLNVLILGGGGREHAICWKLAQSPLLGKLFCMPGNLGIAQIAELLEGDPSDPQAVSKVAEDNQIDLVVIGPEKPLVAGVADQLREAGLLVVGPGMDGARLEASKAFSKSFMLKYRVPTAAARVFSRSDYQNAIRFLEGRPIPVVLKADGLAQGKGVIVAENLNEAKEALSQMMQGEAFGEATQEVLIEEFMPGIEASCFVLTDGQDYVMLPDAKDYKRIGEGDKGLNTGGMGSISPVPFMSGELTQVVEESIVKPTLAGLRKEGIPYIGFLFIGLMITNGVPRVVEYNARLGDPETQSILPRIESDFLELLVKAASGKLAGAEVKVSDNHACTIVLASEGYPGEYQTGLSIAGLDLPGAPGIHIFQAGTSLIDGRPVTNGGRVLAVTSVDNSLEAAKAKAIQSAEAIAWPGRYYRRDIGHEFAV